MAVSNSEKSSSRLPVALCFAAFAVVLLVAFFGNRGSDIGELRQLAGNLGGGPLFGGEGILASIAGAAVSGLILVSWFGTGTFVFRYLKIERGDNHSHVLELIRNIATGAIITSLIWFFLGLGGLYSSLAAIILTVVGFVEGGLIFARVREAKTESRVPEKATGFDRALLLFIVVPVGLAFVGALAPPLAKDTLLYHFSVPKAFIAQHGNAFIDGNIASYLALGTEMHAVWAMLLGNLVSSRAGEAAAGAATFLFFPLLLAAVFGWARELDISRGWSLIAVLMVASVPTAFHVASSGYIDLSMALFITLACYSLTRWWKTMATGSLVMVGLFLGGALAVKLTTVFVIAAFALVILLRARDVKNPVAIAPGSDKISSSGKVVVAGFAALLLAGVIASPWYLRTWKATGSPVFPFYMSIWKGEAAGWDAERSNLFQAMNSQYGGVNKTVADYLLVPWNLSVRAQPEQATHFDGVLGIAFLFGMPILIWGLWKFDLPVELKIGIGVSAIVFLFWLFSSQQLRYLLPILPILAIAIATSSEAISERRDVLNKIWTYSISAASIAALLTSFAWFLQKEPLRVVLGGESRAEYLTRNLDYYPYYQWLNTETAEDNKVWLINMRRDTYNIDRPVFSDYLFEDWTLKQLVWESRSVKDLRAKTAAMGISYVLTRHDFLLDPKVSAIVDDGKPRLENESKMKITREFILDPANVVRSDNRFSLVKIF